MKVDIRKDFPMLQQDLIYFDNSATTFKPYCVIDAVNQYYYKESVNAFRGDYDLAFCVSEKYESVRKTVADFINCDSKEVVFTSGASESLNLVAYGYGNRFLNENDIVLTCESEHASSILPWMKVCENKKAKMRFIPLQPNGRIDMVAFEKMLNSQIKVIVIAQVSNVLGYIVDIQKICELAHQYGICVVVDAAQSIAHIEVDVKQLDCDFLAFSAHKMVGPTGIGILYGKYELLDKMDSFLIGGGSNARFDLCGNILLKQPPYKFETGTPAIEAAYGLKAAIEYLSKIGMKNIHQKEMELKKYALEKLKKLDNVIIYNEDSDTGIITFNIKGVFAQDAAGYFNHHKIALRSGQHCAKLLLDFLKTPATLRASFYFYNTIQEINYFIEVCSNISIEKTIDVVL